MTNRPVRNNLQNVFYSRLENYHKTCFAHIMATCLQYTCIHVCSISMGESEMTSAYSQISLNIKAALWSTHLGRAHHFRQSNETVRNSTKQYETCQLPASCQRSLIRTHIFDQHPLVRVAKDLCVMCDDSDKNYCVTCKKLSNLKKETQFVNLRIYK